MRLLTLDRYDGEAWVADNDTMVGTSEDRFLRMDTVVASETEGRRIRVQVGVQKAYRSAWVPTIGSLTSLRFLYTDAESRRNELRYDPATSTAVIPLGVKGGNDYEFTAILPDDRLDRSMAAWPEPVLTVEGGHRADPLIKRVLASPIPPMRKVFVLAKYLRDYGRYSDGAEEGEEQYRVRPREQAPVQGLPARTAHRGKRRAVRRRDGSARQPGRRTRPGGGGAVVPEAARCVVTTWRPGSRCAWPTGRGAPCRPTTS